jgi:hypothetical protein
MRETPFSIDAHLRAEPPPVLYHYTSMRAALSIITEEALWATNVFYLNDSSEYRHVLDAIIERIQAKTLEYSNPAQQENLRTYERKLKNDPFGPIYVASFSSKKDDLTQWRGYCPPGLGVCIGFHTEALQVAAWEELGRIGQIIYINNGEGRTYDELLDSVANPEANRPIWLPTDVQASLDAVNAAPFYKSDAFASECEWRAKFGGAVDLRIGQTIEYRVGVSTLVPYKVMRFPKHTKRFIAEIVIGPSPNLAISVDAMKSFLISNKMATVAVTASNVSFRSW